MTNHTLRLARAANRAIDHNNKNTGASSLLKREHQRKEQAMPGVDFNMLRAEITMQQVLDHLGFQPTSRSGDQLHGPCPVHRSTSAGSRTFSVNLAAGRYYCHKCSSHGNQLELWSAVRKLSLYDAAISAKPRAEKFPGSTAGKSTAGTEEKRHRYFESPTNTNRPIKLST